MFSGIFRNYKKKAVSEIYIGYGLNILWITCLWSFWQQASLQEL